MIVYLTSGNSQVSGNTVPDWNNVVAKFLATGNSRFKPVRPSEGAVFGAGSYNDENAAARVGAFASERGRL